MVHNCRIVSELTAGLGHWENGCVLFVMLDKTGTKIVELNEFVDSAKAKVLTEKLTGAMSREDAEIMNR